MYWIDEAEQTIWRGLSDGSIAEVILKPRLPGALDIAQDTLYWIDTAAGAILRQAIDGTVTDTLVTELSLFPGLLTVLALDPVRRSMYWASGTEGDHTDRDIYRADLGGTNQEVVVEAPRLPSQSALAVDAQAGRLYWVERSPDSSEQRILRANLDGSNVESVVTGLSNVFVLALDTDGGRIYWADNGTGEFRRANLDGTGVETLLTGVYASTLTINSEAGMMYYIVGGTLQQASLDGSSGETLIAELLPLGGNVLPEGSSLTLQGEGQEVYWIDGYYPTRILRARLDGTEVEEVLAGFGPPAGVAIDPIRAHLYWVGEAGEILRAHLDGTGVKTLLNGNCGTGSVTDVELDLLNEKLYWGSVSDCGRALWLANLDGTEAESVPIIGVDYANFIALDPAARKAYWSDTQTFRGIARVDYDGANATAVVEGSACGIALDAAGGRIYWADCVGGKIRRADVEGGEAEDVLTDLDFPFDLELDLDVDQLYWSEQVGGKIRRAALDGTGVEDLFVGLAAPGRLALSFGAGTSVGVGTTEWVPEGHRLWQNHPNPFHSETSIRYVLTRTGHVELKIYDMLGREVAQLVNRQESRGGHSVIFEAGRLPSGVYLYRITTSDFSETRRMVILK